VYTFSIRECYHKSDLNERQGNEAKEKLLSKKLVEVVGLPKVAKKGRRPEALVLTERGALEATRLGLNVQPSAGRKGSLVHRYLMEAVADELRKRGCKVEFEHPLGDGKAVDLLVDGGLAIEVETGDSDVVANVEKLLRMNFERILIVCVDEPVKNKVRELVTVRAPKLVESVIQVGELPGLIDSEFLERRDAR